MRRKATLILLTLLSLATCVAWVDSYRARPARLPARALRFEWVQRYTPLRCPLGAEWTWEFEQDDINLPDGATSQTDDLRELRVVSSKGALMLRTVALGPHDDTSLDDDTLHQLTFPYWCILALMAAYPFYVRDARRTAVRRQRRDRGLCTVCGLRTASPGKTRCVACPSWAGRTSVRIVGVAAGAAIVLCGASLARVVRFEWDGWADAARPDRSRHDMIAVDFARGMIFFVGEVYLAQRSDRFAGAPSRRGFGVYPAGVVDDDRMYGGCGNAGPSEPRFEWLPCGEFNLGPTGSDGSFFGEVLFTRGYLPMYVPILLVAPYPLLALIRGPLRRFRHRRRGRCLVCGYDLTGNVSGWCTECGALA